MRLGQSYGPSAAPRPAPAGSVRPKAAPPRSLTRGESPPIPLDGPALPVSIDYLNISVPNGLEKLGQIVKEWCAFLGVPSAVERPRGLHGYKWSMDLHGKAIIAYGGDAQRGSVLVSVNGSGCNRVHSFAAVHAWAVSVGARITRLDIAADDHDGALLSVAHGIQQFDSGAFKTRGRPPVAQLVDDLGSDKGCTLYVGSRLAGKLVRIYEKGKQLGDAGSAWVRAELELHDKDRVIPLRALVDPVPYLAGSYPYFGFLNLFVCRIGTLRKAAVATLESATRWLRSIGGKTVNALIVASDGDIGQLFARLRRDGVPAKLQAYFHPSGEPLCAA